MDEIPYEELPPQLREPMRLWVEQGIRPGGFTRKVLDLDLNAVLSADSVCLGQIVSIVQWMHTFLRPPMYGSPLKTKGWADAGGLKGIEALTKADQA